MKLVSAGLIFLFAWTVWAESGDRESLEASCQELYDRYGVNIWYDTENNAAIDRLADPDVKLVPLEAEDLLVMQETIEKFLDSHESSLIRKSLKNLVIVSKIYMHGTRVGGFYSSRNGDSIFVTYEPEGNFIDRKSLLHRLNHEFAHLVHRRWVRLFPQSDWNRAMADHEYLEVSGLAFIQDRAYIGPWKVLQEQGFLTPYNQTNQAEDVAVLLEWYFADFDWLAKMCSRYSLIDEKLKVIDSFYQKVLDASAL